MASPAYTNGFFNLFVHELAAVGRPVFPQKLWFVALRRADLAAGIAVVRRIVEDRPLGPVYCYQLEHERRFELVPADRSPEIIELDERCSAFLAKRGLETYSAWTRTATG